MMGKADISTPQSASTIYTATISNIASIPGLMYSLTLHPHSVYLLEKSTSNDGNSLGLSPSDGPLVSVLLLTTWQNKSDDETVFATIKASLEKVKAESEAKDTVVNYVYELCCQLQLLGSHQFLWQGEQTEAAGGEEEV